MHDLIGSLIDPRTLGLALLGLLGLAIADFFFRVFGLLMICWKDPNALYAHAVEHLEPIVKAAWALFRVGIVFVALLWCIRTGYVR